MADRNYIIEILLRARDETARAFAEATGRMEAYNAAMHEQEVQSSKASARNQQYVRELNERQKTEQRLSNTLRESKLRNVETAEALLKLETAQKRVTQAEAQNDPRRRAVALNDVKKAEDDLTAALQKEDQQGKTLNAGLARIHANRMSQQAAELSRLRQTGAERQKEWEKEQQIYRDRQSEERAWGDLSSSITKETERSRSESIRRLAQQDAQDVRERMQRRRQEAEFIRAQARADAQNQRQQRQQEQIVAQRATILRRVPGAATTLGDDEATTRAKVRAEQELIRVRRDLVSTGLEEARAEQMVRNVRLQSERDFHEATQRVAQPQTEGKGGFLGEISSIQNAFRNLDTSTSGFDQSIRNAFGFAIVALMQPFAILLVGLVGTMGALASAAIAAGTAMSATFLSGMAQGIPVMGLFAAAMQRLQTVIGFVTTAHQQLQQRFIAAYQTAQLNRMGINQVTTAQHQYSDALFAQQMAVRQVSVAELGLRQARQQATRQLQDLIFQEEQARLAALASSYAVTDAQKALQRAIETGGDVRQAQLQLAQAQVGHQQAVVQAQRAISDATPGSIARQQISQQVQQARLAVVQAERAVTDAQFASAQARAAIIQAQQAARGYNVGIAAQLAYLRSQMSSTEQALAGNISRIYDMFQGVHGRLRPVTDAILQAFIPLSSEIIKIFSDPRIFGALLTLGRQIGSAIGAVSREIFSTQSINNFLIILKDSAQNLPLLARIGISLFRALQAVVVAAGPSVHQFLSFIATLLDHWSRLAASTKGQNWLKSWFDTAFQSLQAFVSLGVSIAQLIAAIIGVGGGANAGIKILQSFQGWIDRLTASINSHGKVWKDLQTVWASIKPALGAIGEIFRALVRGFLTLAGSPQGRKALKDVADLIAYVLIPALVQMAINVGKVTGLIVGFLAKHPLLSSMLKDLLGIVLTISLLSKGVGLIFGPLAAGISILKALSSFLGLIARALGIVIPGFGLLGDKLRGFGRSGLAGRMQTAIERGGITAGNEMAARIKEAARSIRIGGGGRGGTAPLLTRGSTPENPLFVFVINEALGGPGLSKRTGGGGGAPGSGEHPSEHPLPPEVPPGEGGRLAQARTAVRAAGTRLSAPLRRVTGQVGSRIGAARDIFTGSRLVRGLTAVTSKIPVLDVATLAAIFATSSGGTNQRLASTAESFDPTSWFGLNKGQGVLGFAFNPLLKRIGTDTFRQNNPELTAPRLQQQYGVPISYSFHRLTSGQSPDKIVSDYFASTRESGVPRGSQQFGTFTGSLGSFIGGVQKSLAGIDKRKAIDTGKELGKGVHDGVAEGVKGLNTLLNRPLTQMLVNGRKALGISSPSRRMEEIGQSMIQGLHRGVAGMAGIGREILMRILRGAQQNWKEIAAIGSGIGLWVLDGVNSIKDTVGRDTQRSIFNPILDRAYAFQKSFIADWKDFWYQVAQLTSKNIRVQEDDFKSLAQNLKDIWTGINQDTQDAFKTLLDNFKTTLTDIDQNIHDAFKYITDATNNSLKAFQATPVHISLGAIPKFAGGGFIGNMGERGKDLVHAVLGRGEAVLNYAHQSVVEPAMRAYYGFGLDKMFQRVRGEHGASFGGGYAAGGYVYPFAPGTVVGRTDQGVDADPPAGSSIGPMGLARVMGIIQNWYKGQPFVWWKLLNGVRAGAYGYVSEGIGKIAQPGSTVQPNQAVAVSEPHGTGIEYGWATAMGQTLARVTGGYSEGQQTAAGQNMRSFLSGLAHGKLVGAALAGAAGAGGAFNDIKDIAVHGTGPLRTILHRAIERVRNAANQFGAQQAGGAGQGGGFIGKMVGNIMQLAQAAAKYAGVPWIPNIVRALLGHESAGGVNEPPSGPLNATGPFQVIPSTFREHMAPGHGDIRNPWDNALAAFRYIKSRYHTLGELAALTGVMGSGYKGYAQGGVIGQAVPIIAHVGEWVLNKFQQSKIARLMGTSVDHLKDFLGFGRAQRQQFQGGGEVLPTVGPGGAFQTTNAINTGEPGALPAFTLREIGVYNRATRFIVNRIERSIGGINKGIQTFISNFNDVGGDNGLFALAATAIDNYVSQQSAVVQLAAAGVRIVNRVLRFGRPQTDLQAAQTDLAATERETTAYERLRGQTVQALRGVNRQIRELLRRSRGHLVGADLSTYQSLIGARNQFITDIQSDTQKVAQGLADQFQKAQTAFQARLDQLLRGPNLAAALAQAAQSIAQTLGRTDILRGTDQAVISASQQQVNALQDAYNQAAARARRDPRWQKTADDLATQLANAQTTLVQAQAQALQDAISAIDIQGQQQQTRVDLLTRLSNVAAAITGNQMGAITQQIGISQTNAAGLQNQLTQYQGLFAQAQAQGNQQVMIDLGQKIADLTAQVAEANLNTQQLITSLHETAISIMQATAQNTSGFFSAASSIVQTLGQITGSLNLPQQIQILREATATLVTQAANIIKAITDTMSDPNNPFGQFQGQANQLLTQLIAAFQQGPAQFAMTLAQLSPQLAALEALMPPDMATLFQNLVQSMIDNTTATVDNSQQLQQLNATTNQQQFASSAWTMFRNAIFNGLGGLLPQYAMAVPAMDVGGYLSSSGLLYGHKDEMIVPAGVVKSGEFGSTHNENHFYFEEPMEVADPVHLSNAIAWKINHNPNAR